MRKQRGFQPTEYVKPPTIAPLGSSTYRPPIETYTIDVTGNFPFVYVEASRIAVNPVGVLEFYIGNKLIHAKAPGEWKHVMLGDVGKVVSAKEGTE